MKADKSPQTGLTLVEMLVTMVVIAALGLMIFSILYTGTTLGAKNTAVNTAHQQARAALLQMTQNLHAAISAPELVDVNGNATAATPAAGFAFEQWAGGPFQITQDAADATSSVVVDLPQPVTAGQRLIIPGFNVEEPIAADANAGVTTINLVQPSPAPSPVPITGTQGPTNYNVTCFATNRPYYVVKNNTLEWHPTGAAGNFVVLARGVDSATPFSIAANNAVKVDLSTFDSKSSNRGNTASDLGFKSTRLLLSETIPVRANPPLATLP
ncbi:MAG: PulJ/GspJ family protein [Chthoniobacterales bacterium]